MLEKINNIIVDLPSIIINSNQIKEIEEILNEKNFKLCSIKRKKEYINGLEKLQKYKINFITDLSFEFINEIEQKITIVITSEKAFISFPEDLESKTINLLRNIYYILIKNKSKINPRILRRFAFIFSISIIIILNLLNWYLKFIDSKTLNNIIIYIEIFWGFNFFLGQLSNYSKMQLHFNKLTQLFHYRLIYILFLLSNLLIIFSYYIINIKT